MNQKDNFTKRYFKDAISQEYNNSVKNQIDIINQPTAADAAGDSFSKAGSMPANGAAQRESNALLSGIGGGIKGAANAERQEKLSPLLEKLAAVNAMRADLVTQQQEGQKSQEESVQFVQSQGFALSELAKAITAGDNGAVTNIAKGILAKLKTATGDASIGEMTAYAGGTMYYTDQETGEPTGVNLENIFEATGLSLQKILGSGTGEEIESALVPGSKLKYENERALMQQQIKGGQAKIENTQADTGLKDAQVEKVNAEAANPPITKNDELRFKLNSEGNNKHLNELKSNITEKDLHTKILVLDKLDKLIQSESSAGGTPKDMLFRAFKKATGYDGKLTEAKMLQKYFFADIKGVAGNPNAKEWDDLVSRIVSMEQNVDASRSIIALEREQAQNAIHEYEDYAEILSEGNPDNLSHHSPKVAAQIKERKEARQFVMMVDPETGEQDRIKKEDVEEARKEHGLELVNE